MGPQRPAAAGAGRKATEAAVAVAAAVVVGTLPRAEAGDKRCSGSTQDTELRLGLRPDHTRRVQRVIDSDSCFEERERADKSMMIEPPAVAVAASADRRTHTAAAAAVVEVTVDRDIHTAVAVAVAAGARQGQEVIADLDTRIAAAQPSQEVVADCSDKMEQRSRSQSRGQRSGLEAVMVVEPAEARTQVPRVGQGEQRHSRDWPVAAMSAH